MRRNRFLRYFNKLLLPLTCIWAAFPALPSPAQGTGHQAVVVIDAGHGGKDPGAIGRKTQEKAVTLAVALKLGKLITENLPGVKVLYTRDKDEFIELFQRANLANKNKAALFISIHCNANKNKTLRGAETYIMGLHRTQANLEVAKFENASILLESDYSAEYEGFDPNSDESYIIFSLYQNANLDMSTRLAAAIQEQMSQRVGLTDRGVRQAGFLVLYKTAMPSVLAEIGYLSNAEEEDFLISSKGQDYISSALFRAVREFMKDSGSAAAPPAPSEVFYSVQVKSSARQLNVDAANFKGLSGVKMYRQEGTFKYYVGREHNLDKAFDLLDTVRKKGYADAFVIAFKGSERITVLKAKEILGQ